NLRSSGGPGDGRADRPPAGPLAGLARHPRHADLPPRLSAAHAGPKEGRLGRHEESAGLPGGEIAVSIRSPLSANAGTFISDLTYLLVGRIARPEKKTGRPAGRPVLIAER